MPSTPMPGPGPVKARLAEEALTTGVAVVVVLWGAAGGAGVAGGAAPATAITGDIVAAPGVAVVMPDVAMVSLG